MTHSKSLATKYIVYVAVFVAISVVLNIFGIPLGGGSTKISFTYIPCFLAGIFLGPFAGFLVGLLGDILGLIVNPQDVWIPLITVASALLGLIPGIVFKIKNLHPYVKLTISLILVFIICSCVLNTTGLFLTYANGKKTFWVYLIGRLPVLGLIFMINSALLYMLYYPMKRLLFSRMANIQ